MGQLAVITTEIDGVEKDLYPVSIPEGIIDPSDKKALSEDLPKIKDKTYDSAGYSGLGRAYLKKKMGDGVNTLTQAMISFPNTVYIIEWDFDLNGETLEVPADCVLDFRGGSFSNGTLEGNNTLIKGYDNIVFGEGLTIQGTYANDSAKTGWFKTASGCIDSCQVISKHVQISDSRNYGTANLQDGCVLDVNGQDAVFNLINTYGEYVYIDLAGGSIGSTFGGGLVAETVTGGNTFVAQDGHSFYVGQRLHSSKNVGAKTFNFFGSANVPLEDPVLITAIDGNTITINKDLGSYTLHQGLGLGNTSWDRFIETYGKKLVISNGIIKNIYSYVCTTWSDGLVEFNHVDFKNLGLDSFHLSYYATLSFNCCHIARPIDYAKTSIMLYQGNVIANNCKIDGGNFDYFLGCWQGDYDGDDTVDRGVFRITNCEFDGTKYDTDPDVKNNLHCIGIEKNGIFNEFRIENCTFKGYERQVFSSSTIKVNYTTNLGQVTFDSCHFIGVNFANFILDSIDFDSFDVKNCIFDGVNTGYFLYIYFSPTKYINFDNCKFLSIVSYNYNFTDNYCHFTNCIFKDCSIYRARWTNRFYRCSFDNTPLLYSSLTQDSVNMYDQFVDCTFKSVDSQFTFYGGTVYGLIIANSSFISCGTIIKGNSGTNIADLALINCTAMYFTYIINALGYEKRVKIVDISAPDTFSADNFIMVGGESNTIVNCFGIENFSGGQYPPVESTSSEDGTE